MSGEKSKAKRVYDIAVIGARGTGKTSLIASMFGMFNEETALHGMRLETEDTRTRSYLADAHSALKEISSQLLVVEPGIGSNPLAFKDLEFDLKTGADTKHARIRFTDYPGEWTGLNDELKSRVGRSPAVIVAIDAPALMWEHGKLSARWNTPSLIQAALSDWLADRSTGKRLVMFCPVKCESWVQDESQQQLLEAEVDRQFSAAIGLLKSAAPKTRIIYAPVQTTGSLRHNRFDKLPDGGYESKFIGTQGGHYDPQWVLNPLIASLAAIGDQTYSDESVGDFVFRRNAKLKKAAREFASRPLEGPAKVWQARG